MYSLMMIKRLQLFSSTWKMLSKGITMQKASSQYLGISKIQRRPTCKIANIHLSKLKFGIAQKVFRTFKEQPKQILPTSSSEEGLSVEVQYNKSLCLSVTPSSTPPCYCVRRWKMGRLLVFRVSESMSRSTATVIASSSTGYRIQNTRIMSLLLRQMHCQTPTHSSQLIR